MLTSLGPTSRQRARTANQSAPTLAARQERKLFAEGLRGRSAPKKLPRASSSERRALISTFDPRALLVNQRPRHHHPPNSIPISHLSTRNFTNLQKWTHRSSPSSWSRSPVSWAVPVRNTCPDPCCEDKQSQTAGRWANLLLLPDDRIPRWCYPGPRRVHGRPDPIDHPKRQGTRYEQSPAPENRSPQPVIAGTGTANTDIMFLHSTVRENDILCLLESEREARRLR